MDHALHGRLSQRVNSIIMSTLSAPPADSVLPPSAPARRPAKRWTKAEFNAAVERGWFAGSRIYLYRGELVEMPAMGTLHARGITAGGHDWLAPTVMRACRSPSARQGPFELPDESMPQPEFVVCTPEQAGAGAAPGHAAECW